MHATYSFHFLDTVSEQLILTLNALPITVLNEAALTKLQDFQNQESAKQGIYLLHYDENPVYLGKATDVRARLSKHLNKLTGRKNLFMSRAGYKALLLDKSLGTAANETLLISIFKQSHSSMWNGQGFGPNDPGKYRDKTQPGTFDSAYPINENWPIDFSEEKTSIGFLLKNMKSQLPYVLRYEIAGREADQVDLTGVPRKARDMLQTIVTKLGAGWKGVILSYGMIIYRTQDSFPFGVEILPEAQI